MREHRLLGSSSSSIPGKWNVERGGRGRRRKRKENGNRRKGGVRRRGGQWCFCFCFAAEDRLPSFPQLPGIVHTGPCRLISPSVVLVLILVVYETVFFSHQQICSECLCSVWAMLEGLGCAKPREEYEGCDCEAAVMGQIGLYQSAKCREIKDNVKWMLSKWNHICKMVCIVVSDTS